MFSLSFSGGFDSPSLRPIEQLNASVARYRDAVERHEIMEDRIRALGPIYGEAEVHTPGFNRMLGLERDAGSACFDFIESGRLLIESLDANGLKGIVAHGYLYAIADIEPEGDRRIMTVPVNSVLGLDLIGGAQ